LDSELRDNHEKKRDRDEFIVDAIDDDDDDDDD
jgi:hypothetical protein